MTYDIVIIGGGMVGATVACALSQRTSLSIAILEAHPDAHPWDASQYHHRVSAISLSSQRIFSAINSWAPILQKRVSPFTKMAVWDAASTAAIHFDSRDIATSQLGFIIENNAIQTSLMDALSACSNVNLIAPVALKSYENHADFVEFDTENHGKIRAKLAIAADGAHSWLREKAGISITKKDYAQSAIVTTVTTELPHEKTARQVFLSSGPLAFLPLNEAHESSIVWALPTEEAENMLALEDELFKTALANAFDNRLGKITSIQKRHVFPLSQQQANSYIAPRVALVGDAAHTMHPLAGQGVNVGLLDAASLVDVITNAVNQRRDFASHATLRRYERWRKADNALMLNGIDVIKSVFANDKPIIKSARSVGLQLTESIQPLKNLFIRYAMGERGDLPFLAR